MKILSYNFNPTFYCRQHGIYAKDNSHVMLHLHNSAWSIMQQKCNLSMNTAPIWQTVYPNGVVKAIKIAEATQRCINKFCTLLKQICILVTLQNVGMNFKKKYLVVVLYSRKHEWNHKKYIFHDIVLWHTTNKIVLNEWASIRSL